MSVLTPNTTGTATYSRNTSKLNVTGANIPLNTASNDTRLCFSLNSTRRVAACRSLWHCGDARPAPCGTAGTRGVLMQHAGRVAAAPQRRCKPRLYAR